MAGELNLNQLKAFYYAANCSSITIAAEKLFITQPAVSMQIKALEEQYGVQLFIRGKKRLELTDGGKRLYQIAKKVFSLVGDAEQLLARSKEVLKVGSTKTLVRYMLAKYISKFQKAYPKIQIEIHEGSSEEMAQRLLKNEIDLAIVGRTPYSDKLEAIPFNEDEIVLLVAPNHPLCRKGLVSIEDLSGYNLILREKGSGTRLVVERVLEGTSLVSTAFIESGNVDFIKELVRIGNGIALLARMGVDHDVERGDLRILRLKEGPFFLCSDIVMNKDRTLSKADEAFLEVLLEGTTNAPSHQGSAAPSLNESDAAPARPSGERRVASVPPLS